MRLRVLLIACALAVLAFSGLRQFDHGWIGPVSNTAAPSQLSSPPAPEPSPPAVVPDATTTAPTTQTPLTPGWHRHLRPADTATIASRLASRAITGAIRPLTFPLLI